MDDEEHLERLQQAVLKWHEWQASNRPPLADLSRANLGSVREVSRPGPTSLEKPLYGRLARVIGRVLRRRKRLPGGEVPGWERPAKIGYLDDSRVPSRPRSPRVRG
jgi:hypothetical protein